MRLLLTTHVFFPDYSAGTEVLTLHTAQQLRQLGHEVEICTGYPSREALPESKRFDVYEYQGIPVNRFFHMPVETGEQKNVVEAEYNNLFFARWFRKYIQRYAPDVVHFFHLGLLSASAIDVCHELGIPMAMTPTDFWMVCPNNQLRLPDNSPCQGPDENSVNCLRHAVANSQPALIVSAFNSLPGKVVAKLAGVAGNKAFAFSKYGSMVDALSRRSGFLRERMNKLDKVIAPTRLMEEVLVRNGLEQNRILFSPYGIQLPIEVAPKKRSEVLRIGFVGGLSEHKGAHLLIEAIRHLPEKSFDLRIFGNSEAYPEYYQKLLELADNHPDIHFCGTFPNEEIGRIFSELDVLVVPSVWQENTPLVIYSAQAAGCPVIASNMKGISEVIQHEVNGLLFEAGNIDALADALKRLVMDRSLLQHLTAHRIKPKSIQEYALELQAIYRDILKEKATA